MTTAPPLVRASAGADREAGHEPTRRQGRGLRPPSLAAVVGAGAALWGLAVGLAPLRDNSFLTHLATGRLILADGGVPRTDSFSFTAPGDPWVVQSWLASLLYAGAEEVGGLVVIRLLVGALTAGLALVVWCLTRRAQGLLPRIALTAGALVVGLAFWSERPLLFGLLAFGLVLLAAEGDLDPRWLVPVLWVWVNAHGSFPLAFVALVLLALGRRMDGGQPARELRALKWAAVGLVLAAVNPLGPGLLTFPLELLRRSDSFTTMVEWQPPAFDSIPQWVFLLQVLAAMVLLVRHPRWRAALPTVAFVGASLLAVRNVPAASLVMLPGMAAAARGLGTVDGAARSHLTAGAVAALVGLGAVLTASSMAQADTDLRAYPEEVVTWMEDHDLIGTDVRVVSRDFVGNYLTARYGPDRARVFIDDRVDMYPPSVVRDYHVLLDGEPGWDEVLRRHRADAVLWDRAEPLAQLLVASPDWEVVHSDDEWLVARPAG